VTIEFNRYYNVKISRGQCIIENTVRLKAASDEKSVNIYHHTTPNN